MPKVLEDLVGKLERQGKPKSNAYAIATSALQKQGKLKKGTQKLAKKGKSRERQSKSLRNKKEGKLKDTRLKH